MGYLHGEYLITDIIEPRQLEANKLGRDLVQGPNGELAYGLLSA